MPISFAIPANIVLESVIILIHIYIVVDKEFTVEKTYIYFSLGLVIWMLMVSIVWCCYFARKNAGKNRKFLRICKIIRGFEAILSCSAAVVLVFTVKSSDLSKSCLGFNTTTTQGPCQRFAFMFLAAILAVLNGLLYFFHPIPNTNLENIANQQKSPPTTTSQSAAAYPTQLFNPIYPSLAGINPTKGLSMDQPLTPPGAIYVNTSFSTAVPTLNTAIPNGSQVQPQFTYSTNNAAPSGTDLSKSGL